MVTQIRNPQSPQYDTPFPNISSPLRGLGSGIQNGSSTSSDGRMSLQRRFTTNVVPTAMGTLSAIGQQRRQAAESMDSTFWHVKKQQDIETARASRENFHAASRDNFQTAMAAVAQLDPAEKAEILRRIDLNNSYSFGPGHQSEPTTPPEYRESGFSSGFPRLNRYSAASMASPPGLTNRPSRSGSQMTSPPSDLTRIFTPIAHVSSNASHIPSKSMPGSRRNSDEDDDYLDEVADFAHRSQNRISMPVTASDLRDRTDIPDLASVLGHVNTTKFLFDEDDVKPSGSHQSILTSPESKPYLQMKTTKDNFPMLVNSGQNDLMNSAMQSALDLSSSQATRDVQSNGWAAFRGHRAAPSLPADAFNSSIMKSSGLTKDTALKATAGNRRSLEVKFDTMADFKRPSPLRSPGNGAPKLQSSYSTNDIPTLKQATAIGGSSASGHVTPNAHAEQRLHNHNASLGRMPPDTLGSRHSREVSADDDRAENPTTSLHALQSALQANATAFGPTLVGNGLSQAEVSAITPSSLSAIQNQAYYGGYGMQMLNMGMGNLVLGNQAQWNSPMQQVYQGAYGAYPSYQQYGPAQGRFADSQARIVQQRRLQNGDDNARFANAPLESLKGEIYGLCKDQHGCRFLQKKLDDRKPEHVELIFSEVNEHVIELMTDPFGNYLVQKLLESVNDSQRTVLINNAAPQMVQIALNQHGTRALQKMIDFISTGEQIQTIIFALKDKVVQLIQDLNGNHVIQKCLNRLSPEDAQFIFDAVGAHCVVVGTHRHGCCVLQRCIDHASGYQKAQLIEQITANAFALVQDPFGNYVVQYILDLGEPAFSGPLCESFLGSIAALSRQKFSSNVIEKCIRTADADIKRRMIEEMINPVELERLLRDSFANYVVQTAMDYADPETRSRLIENIRPILPAIRHTPYGRRIQGKIQDRDGRHSNSSSGQITPHESSASSQLQVGNQSAHPYHRTNLGHPTGVFSNPGINFASSGTSLYNNAVPSISGAAPGAAAHRYGNANMPMYSHGSNYVQQSFSPYGRGSQHTWTTDSSGMGRAGMNFY